MSKPETRPERIFVHEKPVSFIPEEFDPKAAKPFLPNWELVVSEGAVAFVQDFNRTEEDDALSRRQLLINLESGRVDINTMDDDKEDYSSLASISGVEEIRMHTRFGNVWVTFKSADGYLVFQPQNMNIAIITSKKPLGSSMLLR